MDALRALPVSTIRAASSAVWNRYDRSVCWPFQPVIDGLAYANGSLVKSNESDPLLPDLPVQSWRKAHYLDIPVMTGFNTK